MFIMLLYQCTNIIFVFILQGHDYEQLAMTTVVAIGDD